MEAISKDGYFAEMRAAGKAIAGDDPIRFMQAYDRMSEILLSTGGASPQAIANLREDALRVYLAASHAGLTPGLDRIVLPPMPGMWTAGDDPRRHIAWGMAKLAKWAHGKRIYRLNRDALRELVASIDDETAMPGEILRKLPHPDAFVWLPCPLEFESPSSTGGANNLETWPGFFLTGLTADRTGCQLDHPDAAMVQIEYHGITGGGSRVVPMRYALSVPMSGYYSLATMAQETADHRGDPDAIQAQAMLRCAMAVLTYLASVGLDIVERRPARKARRATGLASGVKRYDVGYRIGPALAATSSPHAPGHGSTGSGISVAPHIRRGHFHTYRHGKGKALSMVKWIAPIAVNSDRGDPAAIPTVHRVGGPKR
jgi:hypothetical protein